MGDFHSFLHRWFHITRVFALCLVIVDLYYFSDYFYNYSINLF